MGESLTNVRPMESDEESCGNDMPIGRVMRVARSTSGTKSNGVGDELILKVKGELMRSTEA